MRLQGWPGRQPAEAAADLLAMWSGGDMRVASSRTSFVLCVIAATWSTPLVTCPRIRRSLSQSGSTSSLGGSVAAFGAEVKSSY